MNSQPLQNHTEPFNQINGSASETMKKSTESWFQKQGSCENALSDEGIVHVGISTNDQAPRMRNYLWGKISFFIFSLRKRNLKNVSQHSPSSSTPQLEVGVIE